MIFFLIWSQYKQFKISHQKIVVQYFFSSLLINIIELSFFFSLSHSSIFPFLYDHHSCFSILVFYQETFKNDNLKIHLLELTLFLFIIFNFNPYNGAISLHIQSFLCFSSLQKKHEIEFYHFITFVKFHSYLI